MTDLLCMLWLIHVSYVVLSTLTVWVRITATSVVIVVECSSISSLEEVLPLHESPVMMAR